MFGIGPTEFIILLLIVFIGIVPFWKIFSKAGYSGALSLLMLIPLANIVLILILAFSKWPIEKKLEELEAK